MTLAHEHFHRQQFRRLRDFDGKQALEVMDREEALALSAKEHSFHEIIAYQSEIWNLASYRRARQGSLTEAEIAVLDEFEQDAAQKRDSYITGAFTSEEREALLGNRFTRALELMREGAPAEAFRDYSAELEDKLYVGGKPLFQRPAAFLAMSPEDQHNLDFQLRRKARLERWNQKNRQEYLWATNTIYKLVDEHGIGILD